MTLKVGIAKHPYNGHLHAKEIDPHAAAMEEGLKELLKSLDCEVVDYQVSYLTPEEENIWRKIQDGVIIKPRRRPSRRHDKKRTIPDWNPK
jgi:hypothetical protein